MELVRTELDDAAAVFWEQHLVADRALHWDQVAFVVAETWTDGDDFAFVLLLLVSVWQVNAAGSLPPNKHTHKYPFTAKRFDGDRLRTHRAQEKIRSITRGGSYLDGWLKALNEHAVAEWDQLAKGRL